MIKRSRQGNGLREYASAVTFIDTDSFSKNYFRIMDFPDRFYVGKNLFRISGNDNVLVKGSQIFIDVVDANGNIMYHEVLNVKNSDRSRTIVVYVYPDSPVGEATVYIAGRINTDPRTRASIPYSEDPTSPYYKNIPNIMWIGKTNTVTTKPNTSEVFFSKEPTVFYKERQVSFYTISGSTNRIVETTGSASDRISITSRTQPAQYGNESVFKDEITEASKTFRGLPTIENNAGTSTGASVLPEHSRLTVLTSNNPLFIREMEGGKITVTNITVDELTPSDAAAFTIPDYSASIVKVLNERSVEVDTPFIHKVEYISLGQKRNVIIDKFISQPDFSISYVDTSMPVSKTWASESFVSMEFMDIEPSAGTVDKVRISYKPIGSFGDFIDVGEFPIWEQNFLIDSGNFELTRERGIAERPIGFPRTQAEVDSYWTVTSRGVSGTSLQKLDQYVIDGFRINHSGSDSPKKYLYVKQNNHYASVTRGTEYVLRFKTYSDGDPMGASAWNNAFMDVYISGSGITSDIVSRGNITEPILSDLSLGTYVGSVVGRNGRIQDNSLYFIAHDTKNISPVFVVRSGLWNIGQITLSPRKEIGFSPNHVKLDIPLNRFEESSELIIDIDYLNKDGVAANVDTKLYGVYFAGGTSPLSQSIVIVNDSLIETSSSLSSRITGTISGSYINYYDHKSGSIAGTLSRLEISGMDIPGITGSHGGQFGLVGLTSSMGGGDYVIRNETNKVRSTTNEFVYSKFLGKWNTSASVSYTVGYPILVRTDNGKRYRLDESVQMMYEINAMIVGYSGSSGTYYDSYAWAGTLRGRMIADGNGNFDFNHPHVSSGSLNYESFGRANSAYTNHIVREKSLQIITSQSANTLQGDLEVGYRFGSYNPREKFDMYVIASIKVIKFEFFTD